MWSGSEYYHVYARTESKDLRNGVLRRMIEYPPVIPDSVQSATLLRSRGFYGISIRSFFCLPMALWAYAFGIPPFQ